jgi:hypothetical protein
MGISRITSSISTSPIRYLGVGLIALAVLASASVTFEPHPQKPARSDCIVGVDLEWSQIPVQEQNHIRNTMFTWRKSEAYFLAKNLLRGISLTEDGSRIYFQFSSDCAQKKEMAITLLKFWQSSGQPFPAYRLVGDPITPSPSTIDLCNDEWRDCPSLVPLVP